jgi:hypothetical protein
MKIRPKNQWKTFVIHFNSQKALILDILNGNENLKIGPFILAPTQQD